jgi:oligopeptidase B
LTASDYEEFGNPLTSSEIYDNIHSFSPYDNIVNQEYPFVFITVGEEDFRAPMWAVLKYAKRLRERKKDNVFLEPMENKGVIVDCQDGGHQGENGILEHVYKKSVWLGVLDHIIKTSKEIKED